MIVLAAALFVTTQSHSCVKDPQCFACEQSFEACVPDPIFHTDEELRFEYADGKCSCDLNTCHTQESQYSFIDPHTEAPVVVFRLKCCPNALECTTTTTTTTPQTTTPSLETVPDTTETTTASTTDTSMGSGDAADDAVIHRAKSYHSSPGKSGASAIYPAGVFLVGAIFYL